MRGSMWRELRIQWSEVHRETPKIDDCEMNPASNMVSNLKFSGNDWGMEGEWSRDGELLTGGKVESGLKKRWRAGRDSGEKAFLKSWGGLCLLLPGRHEPDIASRRSRYQLQGPRTNKIRVKNPSKTEGRRKQAKSPQTMATASRNLDGGLETPKSS
ncbi:hypothetical protein K469DRAFT_684842 [Zopfia rhizophila CBS 207.26]|uniref:Uncharacterized protein n=1 Tax=Zopfia rhizophila CBS 207.26 TaxID=1314779 RepID=A0A6A6ED95_9PEZI|nr:hypothetical protein K469DRAFT_684842 [Zopfia rhizophila CBS 207.26]